MSPQRGGAVADATDPESNQDPEQQPRPSMIGSLDELIALAQQPGSGHTFGTGKPPPAKGEEETPPADETPPAEETPPSDETPAEETPAEETPPGDETPPADETPAEEEPTNIEKQISDLQSQGKEVPWYLPRIAQETKQKNKYREEAGKAVAHAAAVLNENALLKAQLAEVSDAGSVTQENPLANVWNEAGIKKFKKEAKRYIAWCDENPQGGECPFAKDEEGNALYLDEKGVRNLKRNTENALDDGIEERKAFLARRQSADAQAAEVYPDYKNPESAFYRAATQLVESFPPLKQVPEIYMWIGHALVGRELAYRRVNGKNGDGKTSEKILASRGKVAPTVVKARSQAPRPKGSDLAQAKKALKETRGQSLDKQQDAALAYLDGAISIGGRARKIERVES